MGSGKTHWGRQWSENSGIRFFDLDERIEKAARKSIVEIFEKKGEEKFREMERLHLRKFGRKKNFILACGGGTPCFFDNLQWMKASGKVIYLEATPEEIAANLKNEIAHRPVLTGGGKSLVSFVKEKLWERKKYYEQADVIAKVKTLTPDFIQTII